MKNMLMMATAYTIAVGCNQAALPSKTPYANTEIKNDKGNIILAGHCSVNMMRQAPYDEWFDKSYDTYTVDTPMVQQLNPLLRNKRIEIFLGSWCGDSKREVPRMIKILEAASFDTSKLSIVFVDNSTATYKQSPQHEEQGKNIHRVPTFIFYNGTKETGRIVEYPVVSLEKDMIAILSALPYTPHYKSIPYWQQNIKQAGRHFTDDQLQKIAETVKPLCEGIRDFYAYGYVLLAKKNFGEALNVFRLNTLLYPESALVYSSLGEACLITGDKAKAKSSYEKALTLKPGDMEIANKLQSLN